MENNKTFKIDQTGTPIKKSSIAALEEEMCVQLPSDYREFLQEYNGGFPEYEFFRSEKEKPDICLAGFSSILFSNTKADFQEFLIDDPLIDEKFIVIGFDGCGNYLCMRKNGKDKGKLFFFDSDTDEQIWEIEDIDPKKTCVVWCAAYKVQDSFKELIMTNYDEEEIYD